VRYGGARVLPHIVRDPVSPRVILVQGSLFGFEQIGKGFVEMRQLGPGRWLWSRRNGATPWPSVQALRSFHPAAERPHTSGCLGVGRTREGRLGTGRRVRYRRRKVWPTQPSRRAPVRPASAWQHFWSEGHVRSWVAAGTLAECSWISGHEPLGPSAAAGRLFGANAITACPLRAIAASKYCFIEVPLIAPALGPKPWGQEWPGAWPTEKTYCRTVRGSMGNLGRLQSLDLWCPRPPQLRRL